MTRATLPTLPTCKQGLIKGFNRSFYRYCCHFIDLVLVPIAYGKGAILKVPYEKMTGEFFATFIREHFNLTFANAGPKADGRRLFVMDNDPSQTSRVAKLALEEIEGSFHEIPPR